MKLVLILISSLLLPSLVIAQAGPTDTPPNTSESVQTNEATTARINSSNRRNYRKFNTPVNYDFADIIVGQSLYDGFNINAIALRINSESMIDENWILNMYYNVELIDEPNYELSSDSISLGAMYRFPLAYKFDFVLGEDLIYTSRTLETHSEADHGEYNDSDHGLALRTSLRYAFTRQLEGTLGLNIGNIYDSTFTDLSGLIVFYPTERFGVGVSYSKQFSDLDFSTIAGHVRLCF